MRWATVDGVTGFGGQLLVLLLELWLTLGIFVQDPVGTLLEGLTPLIAEAAYGLLSSTLYANNMDLLSELLEDEINGLGPYEDGSINPLLLDDDNDENDGSSADQAKGIKKPKPDLAIALTTVEYEVTLI